MPALHETAYPRLKSKLTTAELDRVYTPTAAELRLAKVVTKGPFARVAFLVMLKQGFAPPSIENRSRHGNDMLLGYAWMI